MMVIAHQYPSLSIEVTKTKVSLIFLFICLRNGVLPTTTDQIDAAISGRDATIESGTFGKYVVEATINRLLYSGIFGDDMVFLRRIACLESTYGSDSETYRDGYHGGIWQVDETIFADTKNTTITESLQPIYEGVSDLIGKPWSSVQWEELRNPLFSALACRLFFSMQHVHIPNLADLEKQADVWSSYYRESMNSTRNEYLESAEACEENGCHSSLLDVVYIINGARDVGAENFSKMKDFIVSMIGSFHIETYAARVGVIQYSNQTDTEVSLGEVNSKKDLVEVISGITHQGGNTVRTGVAINYLSQLFKTNGRNTSVPRVAILMTNNASGDGVLQAATYAKDVLGINLFAIGIGENVSVNDLDVIASDQKEQYRISVSGFDELGHIKNALALACCKASGTLKPDVELEIFLEPDHVRYLDIHVSDDQILTVKLESENDNILVFFSELQPNPNPAFYDLKVETSENSFIQINTDKRHQKESSETQTSTGQILYVSVFNNDNITSEFSLIAEVRVAHPNTSTLTPTVKTNTKRSTIVIPTTSRESEVRQFERMIGVFNEISREYEGYNGWFNNEAYHNRGGTGSDRPNPFDISWSTMEGLSGKPSFTGKTVFLTFFSQQVVDEILNTRQAGCPMEYHYVDIPEWHEFRNSSPNLRNMPFVRSSYSSDTGISPNVPRNQVNKNTPWIDGGVVYGTTKAWADKLRSFKGGRLADNGEEGEPQYPERNKIGLPLANYPDPVAHNLKDAMRFFKLGNTLGNENPFLLTFGILWFRWHNYWANKLHEENPNWSDEKIYQEARKWVIGTYQKFVFYDWLPAFLGLTEDEMDELQYTGYRSYIDPGITHEFHAAAMRWGHTLVPAGVYRRDDKCQFMKTKCNNVIDKEEAKYFGIRMCNSFWNPQHSVQENGIEPFLMGMASQITEREDNVVVSDLQRRSYGPLNFVRRDLMVDTILRGHDHGLPDYNTVREALGLERIKGFLEINPYYNDSTMSAIDANALLNLAKVYQNNIDAVDLWVGGLFETNARGPGELFRTIILDQFTRIRDADRFWFENERNGLFTKRQIDYIHKLTLHDVITRSTDIPADAIQRDLFHFVKGDPCWDESTDPDKGGHGNRNRTVSELDMEECTGLKTYDYFKDSEISFAVTFALLFIWICVCFGALQILATCQSRGTKEREATTRKCSMQPGKLPCTLHQATEWCGLKGGQRQVKISLYDDKQIKIHNSDASKKYRTIDLSSVSTLSYSTSSDRKRQYVSIEIPKEYDLVLKFDNEHKRNVFISDLEHWLNRPSIGIIGKQSEYRQKYLLASAFTKEDRQKSLERFFKLAFAQVSTEPQGGRNPLSIGHRQSVLEFQLTPADFAECLSMKQDDLFVEQIFQLADKNNHGTISFREFVDVMVVFAKGKPEDKIRMMFNMYDIDGSGTVDRQKFKTMLMSMLDIVNASLESSQLEQVINSMFVAAGFENKQELTLQDFMILMAEHKEDFSESALRFSDKVNAFQNKKEKKFETKRRQSLPGSRKSSSGIKKRLRSKSVSSALSSVAPNLGKLRKLKKFSVTEMVTVTEDSDKTRRWRSFMSYIENHRLHIFWLSLYVTVVLVIFKERISFYSTQQEHKGLRRMAGYGIAMTRGAGGAMMFTYSSLLVVMCRNIITFLRDTFLRLYVPFDAATSMHKIIATLALLFTLIHVVGHAINFYQINTQPSEDLSCYIPDFFHRSHTMPNFNYWCWRTITGVTGILLVLICAVMYTFAMQYARRNVFKYFWLTHKLYIVIYILMLLHGTGHFIQSPVMCYFFLGPAVMFTLDKLVSISRNKAEITVVKAELLPSDVTHLVFRRPRRFQYKPGQWVRIACTELGSGEFHPFTLSSAPHEEHLSLHIRAVGPWTMNLRNTYDPETLGDRPNPKLYLDGPYGEGHQDWESFDVSVLVGGGIGVTPFASILKHIAFLSSIRQRITCRKVHFIWVTRTQKQFEWLTDIIREVEEKDIGNFVTIHLFITQFYEQFDLRTTMLYICERHFQKVSDRSLFTGLRSTTYFGRPNFVSFLSSLQELHQDTHRIGVFSCGPPGMTKGVEKACVELNKLDETKFIHHYENF